MTSKGQDPSPSRPSGIQALFARLCGLAESRTDETQAEEVVPLAQPVEPAGALEAATVEAPAAVEGPEAIQVADEVPLAVPVVDEAPLAIPVADEVEPVAAAEEAPQAPPDETQTCPFCGAARLETQAFCTDCGLIFPPDGQEAAMSNVPADAGADIGLLQGRYEIREQIVERNGVSRHRGVDHGASPPANVVIVRAAVPVAEEAIELESAPADEDVTELEILPRFDLPLSETAPATETISNTITWPSVAWERELLENSQNLLLPRALASFADGGSEYLIEESPAGQSLWEAWDDPAADARRRYGLLKEIAEGLRHLHRSGAMPESFRPELFTVAESGRVVLTDLSELLPLPVPPGAPIKGALYTAPELVADRDQADARANLYTFGALLYALFVGRELTEMDFDGPGSPKPFIPRFPDVHPLFGRLVTKTFCRPVEGRFPSDEAVKEDATGFTELIRTLEVCQRTMDNVRLEIASWTTTGIVRTGNEDAFALIHAAESRQDDLGESALVLLCDGMGGYEAGEFAAALAIQTLRKNLVQQQPCATLAGGTFFPQDVRRLDLSASSAADVETCKKLICEALKEANRTVYTAARTGAGRRGMGCTAEAVYVNSRFVVVGHVGDSRTYHLHEGRLVQLTRDQTLVNRLVELGTLSPEEAESHPRRSELQQAIGGHADVEPALYHGHLKPGDWVVVCSDGLSNHITPDELKQMLQSEATSAEMAARRLVNFVNIKGATDNATVVVIRAT